MGKGGGGGSRVIFHAELMDAASFSSPRYFWPAFHDRDANLFQFCCRGTRTHNDHPNPEFFTNATRQLCSSRAILSNIFISFLEKLYYTDLLLFFVLILKSSRSDRIMREFKTVAVEYDVRALTVSLFVKLELRVHKLFEFRFNCIKLPINVT